MQQVQELVGIDTDFSDTHLVENTAQATTLSNIGTLLSLAAL